MTIGASVATCRFGNKLDALSGNFFGKKLFGRASGQNTPVVGTILGDYVRPWLRCVFTGLRCRQVLVPPRHAGLNLNEHQQLARLTLLWKRWFITLIRRGGCAFK